jgi:hypothetical protein
MVTHMFGTKGRFAMKMHVLWIHARSLLWVVAGLGLFGGQRSPAGESPARVTFKGHTDLVHSVVFSADGKTFASASWDKTAKNLGR